MSNLTLSFETLLHAMVQAKNPDTAASLKVSDYTAAAPSVLDGDASGKNTSIVVTAVQGSTAYTGSQTLKYNRLHIGDDIGATSDLLIDSVGKAKLSDAVADFETKYGIKLEAGKDYTDRDLEPFTGAPGEEREELLTILPTSGKYIGTVLLTIKSATVDLATVIANNVLDGLTYEPPV